MDRILRSEPGEPIPGHAEETSMSPNVEHQAYRRVDGSVWIRRQEYYYPGTRQHRVVWVDESGRRSLTGSGIWEELEAELKEGKLAPHDPASPA